MRLKNKRLLVAVSGGVDSMALLSVLWEIKSVLNLHISVVHVHHGATDKKQRQFQDRAIKTVQNFWHSLVACEKPLIKQAVYLSKKKEIPSKLKSQPTYLSAPQKQESKNIACLGDSLTHNSAKSSNIYICFAQSNLKNQNFKNLKTKPPSEAEMRKLRYQAFADILKKSKADYLILAHTEDDLLETRLIRLIRGTGEQGLKAMSFKKNKLIRPFIHINRSQIMDYAKKTKLKWSEDPTNQSLEYSFRNWIRREWLPILEKKRPGSVRTLSQSLDLVSQKAQNSQKRIKTICQGLIKTNSLRRDIISSFSLIDKKKILAYYIKQQGFKNYQASHILEMLKHINRSQKKFYFSLLGQTWKMDKEWLSPQTKLNQKEEK